MASARALAAISSHNPNQASHRYAAWYIDFNSKLVQSSTYLKTRSRQQSQRGIAACGGSLAEKWTDCEALSFPARQSVAPAAFLLAMN
jgi:hypothetical protein